MKRPWNGWQVIGTMVAVLIPVTMFLVNLARNQSAQGTDIENLKKVQYDNQLKVEREFDKLGAKMDQQSNDIRQILVEMQNKQNRR